MQVAELEGACGPCWSSCGHSAAAAVGTGGWHVRPQARPAATRTCAVLSDHCFLHPKQAGAAARDPSHRPCGAPVPSSRTTAAAVLQQRDKQQRPHARPAATRTRAVLPHHAGAPHARQHLGPGQRRQVAAVDAHREVDGALQSDGRGSCKSCYQAAVDAHRKVDGALRIKEQGVQRYHRPLRPWLSVCVGYRSGGTVTSLAP